MDPKIFFVVFLLGIIGLIIYFRLNVSKSESSNKSNHDAHIDLIKSLYIIDQILEEKLFLAKAGVLLDLGYLDQQVIVMDLIESGKLAIFGKEFNYAITEIVSDAQFDLNIVKNTSSYVKEQLIEYNNLM